MAIMNLTPWNPWQEIERAQAEVESILGAVLHKLRHLVPGKSIAFVPVTDIVEVADEYVLYLSIPGMVEEDVDITLEESVLIVRGEREPPYDPAKVTVHQRQWKYGYFERRVQLPQAPDAELIRVTYDAGVLTIRISKASASGSAPPGGHSEETAEATPEVAPEAKPREENGDKP